MTERETEQIVEMWHNVFRIHGYVEAAVNPVGKGRPALLRRADVVLTATFARVKSLLPADRLRRLETPPTPGPE